MQQMASENFKDLNIMTHGKALLNSKSLQLVSIGERVTTGKDFAYTGVKIEIPPKTTAILQFEAVYGQGKPVSIGVSKSDTSFADGYLVTTCNYPQKCVFVHPAGEKATTYYAWASYSATSDNPVKITGLFSQ